eukprot:scaffold2727_cov275-Chaetoceros_neogracile.AAC.29
MSCQSSLNAQYESHALNPPPPLSPNDVIGIQAGYSTTSSLVSIGSPRSVFVPVKSFEKREMLLPPAASNISNANRDRRDGDEKEYGKLGGVLQAWQAMEKNNAEVLAAKSMNNNAMKEKTAVHEVGKDSYPEVEKSNLSSRARKREQVPFSHIIVKDMDNDSCTTVSSMSYDPREFAMATFVAKHQTDLEANKTLIDETNELIKRIARHNIGGEEGDDDGDGGGDGDDNIIVDKVIAEEQRYYGIEPRPMTDADKENDLVFGSEQLLDEIEEISLPEDIAALLEEADQRENLSQCEARRRLSFLDEMDSDFSNLGKMRNDYLQRNQQQELPSDVEALVEDNNDLSIHNQQQVLSPDIDGLIVDNDLSFDDLRVDSDDEGEKENIDEMPRSHEEVGNVRGKGSEGGSDDEGLSFDKNNDKALVGDLIDISVNQKYCTNLFRPDTNVVCDERDDWIEYPGQLQGNYDMLGQQRDSDTDANDLLQMFNPKMYEKSNFKNYQSRKIREIDDITNQPQMKDSRRSISAQGGYDLAEQGGISNVVQEIGLQKEVKSAIKEQKQVQEEMQWERCSESPPIREIFIPTIHEFCFGFQIDPKVTVKSKGVARVQTKKDNDARIKNIIKRGTERFFRRRRRKKKMTITE